MSQNIIDCALDKCLYRQSTKGCPLLFPGERSCIKNMNFGKFCQQNSIVSRLHDDSQETRFSCKIH